MINNRQAGRRRGRGGQRSQGGGNPGRGPENGNRIDNRARGNAAQLLEKYKTLARDSQMQGDRVNTEYYLQFADHYFRVLAETRSRFEENQPRRGQNDQFEDGDEEDFDGNVEGMADDRVDPYQLDRGPDRGNDRPNDRSERPNGRDNNNRDNSNREGGNRDGHRGNGRDQRDQNREPGNRETGREANGSRGNGPRDSAERPSRRYQPDHEGAAPAMADPQGGEARHPEQQGGDNRPRRGRPPRAATASDAPTGDDTSVAIDADRLPPALSLSAVDNDDPAVEKPRRRRKPAASEATPAE